MREFLIDYFYDARLDDENVGMDLISKEMLEEIGIAKIDYDKRLFNSVYNIVMEMAITDWEYDTLDNTVKFRDRLKQSVIMSDEASGFSDPEFWGEYNVIEPEKPIESAIKKIQKQLEKIK